MAEGSTGSSVRLLVEVVAPGDTISACPVPPLASGWPP